MKAVGYVTSRPINEAGALQDLDLPKPVPGPQDLLVKVEAISVNPVDYKVRRGREGKEGAPVILGWDAVGTVEAIGAAVTFFKPGDAVFYAGDITRAGSNAAYQLVDARIVGHKPRSLDAASAAALPLTALTAYEMLFDRLQVPRGAGAQGKKLLIIGGAGGVGSIAIQLARQLTGITVIATASRPETIAWVKDLGAHHVIDHSKSLPEELTRVGIDAVDYIFSTNATDKHWEGIAATIAPQGRVGLIDDPEAIDVRQLKRKSASLHWELMFTRALYTTVDITRQHEILNEVADLVDQGVIKTTLAENFGTINAANLIKAHALLESGKSIGKIVLSGF
ncbi:MAG TPA: zinc-binding alcohol dehydrogenase family protein [Terriglobales bacterium]|nr:zinc-binding alcohol dehydrogenase family protein [Terriglobales bacterium]